jgi:hypothetical protein
MAALLHWLGITIDPVVDFGEESAFLSVGAPSEFKPTASQQRSHGDSSHLHCAWPRTLQS